MGIVIGIDIGGSTTKIVGISGSEPNRPVTPMLVKAADPVASLFGAFGKFVDHNLLALADISRIMITGVGASFIDRPIYGLPTGKAAEFLCNGYGGLYLSGLERAVICSMGTGTALVSASGEDIEHMGGTGIGGGTIIGLAARMINVHDTELISRLAEDGDLNNVDLMVGDITQTALPGLPPHTTASNFGKLKDMATPNDIALGILNLVFESIGVTASFAVKSTGVRDIVLIGNLTTIPHCAYVFDQLRDLLGINFIIPEHSEYGTALGAALVERRGRYAKLI
ncbi:MAG: type II pantothenate kinase [Defluviitaleaceae bacterium]|nr:type II pantothenate kinase [Defluviitaleaceae bacterium]